MVGSCDSTGSTVNRKGLLADMDHSPSLIFDEAHGSVQRSRSEEHAPHPTNHDIRWGSIVSNVPCFPNTGVYTWVWCIDKCDFGRAALGLSQKPCCLTAGPVGGSMNVAGGKSLLEDGSVSSCVGIRFSGDLYETGQLIKREYSPRLLPGTLIYLTYDSNQDTVSYGNFTERHDFGVAFSGVSNGSTDGLYMTLSLLDPDDKCTLVQQFMGNVAKIGNKKGVGGASSRDISAIPKSLRRPSTPPDSFLVDLTLMVMEKSIELVQNDASPLTAVSASPNQPSSLGVSVSGYHLHPLFRLFLPHCASSLVLWRKMPAHVAKQLLKATVSCQNAIQTLSENGESSINQESGLVNRVLSFEQHREFVKRRPGAHALVNESDSLMFLGIQLILSALQGSLAARLIEANLGDMQKKASGGSVEITDTKEGGEHKDPESLKEVEGASTMMTVEVKEVDEALIRPWLARLPFSAGIRTMKEEDKDMMFLHGITGTLTAEIFAPLAEAGAGFAEWMWETRSKSVIRKKTQSIHKNKFRK